MKIPSVVLFVMLPLTVIGGRGLAETPDAELGVVSEQPEGVDAVAVGDAYMVPYTETIPGTDIQVEMVPIPGGTFRLGSPDSEADHREDESPQIRVTVSPMWVSKCELRWDAYKEYMAMYDTFKEFEDAGIRRVTEDNRVDAVSAPTPLYDPSFTFEYGELPNQPAVSMTQHAAQQFTKWLSGITGRQYRLPTEAEWEYACRGGTATAYHWGDSPDQAEQYAWFFDNSDDQHACVGLKKANAFGLYDMHGGVGEWTVNAYTKDGYQWLAGQHGINATDVVRWPKDSDKCVVRGGTCLSDLKHLRSAARMISNKQLWKQEDPCFPPSPWWFTSDPARSVGLRLFRSYKPLDRRAMAKFWDHMPADVQEDVDMRLDGGRAVLGITDKQLPEAVDQLR